MSAPTLKGSAMTDLEAIKLCAKAMGGRYDTHPDGIGRFIPSTAHPLQNIFAFDRYDPLHDDAQAMALVKRFRLRINSLTEALWCVETDPREDDPKDYVHADLNRAIVYCVATLREGAA
jgi:hypothetical protein